MIRLDLYLSNFGYVKSRQKAKTLIEDGFVNVNGKKITNSSYLIHEELENNIEISDPCPYVSRGGLKLEKAIVEGNVNVLNKTAIDIGASTGGFTDCLLKHGARIVYAVDSGSNQLDTALKYNSRVVSMENYNARTISFEDIGEFCDIITMDVSFISQTLIMPSAVSLLRESGAYISLIKPQFEVGKSRIGKGGIVKNPEDRLFGVEKIIECADALNMKCIYFSKSPILGGDGNTEYLAIFSKNAIKPIGNTDIKRIVLEK
jgi:23S rRNA (cytidine1920-2'-O)/16S rRNA (cytidine1409-2'-O)-methyltransferase